MVEKDLSVPDEVVYSTYPEFEVEYANIKEPETAEPVDQDLIISLNKRKIDGMQVTCVTGFVGKRMDLIQIQEELADVCRTCGSTRMYDIILQRDVRKRVYVYLRNNGFGVRFAPSE